MLHAIDESRSRVCEEVDRNAHELEKANAKLQRERQTDAETICRWWLMVILLYLFCPGGCDSRIQERAKTVKFCKCRTATLGFCFPELLQVRPVSKSRLLRIIIVAEIFYRPDAHHFDRPTASKCRKIGLTEVRIRMQIYKIVQSN